MNKFEIGVRPKSNSSYTAKRCVKLAKVNCPDNHTVLSSIVGDSEDWCPINTADLNKAAEEFHTSILTESTSQRVLAENVKDMANSLGDDVSYSEIYTAISGLLKTCKEGADSMSEMIHASDVLALAVSVYNENAQLEVVIRKFK